MPERSHEGTGDAAPPDSQTLGAAEVALVLLAFALAQALLYTQAAYRFHAAVCGIILLVAFFLAAAPRRAFRGIFKGWLTPLALAAGVLFFLDTFAMDARGFVRSFGREQVSHSIQFALAAGAAFFAARTVAAHRARRLPFAAISALVLILTAESAWAIYQARGPEGMPRTYATLAKELATIAREDSAADEGVMAALRERRAAGTLGSPNIFAGLAAAGAVLALGGTLTSNGRKRALFAFACAMNAAGVLLSGSRGGLLAMIAGCAIMLLVAVVLSRRAIRAPAPALAILLVMLIPLASHADAPPPTERNRWTGHTTVVQRLRYWEAGLAMWRERPVFGNGAGAYAILYPSHRIPGAGETRYAHNWAVQSLVETGLVGLMIRIIGAGAALLLCARASLRLAREGDRTASIATATLGIGALTLLMHGLVDFTLETREGLLVFGAILGLCAGIFTRPSDAETSEPKPNASLGERGFLAFRMLMVPVLFLILTVAHFLPIKEAMLMENMQAMFEDGASPAEIEAAATDAISESYEPQIYLMRARARFAQGDVRGFDDLHEAAKRNPWSAAVQDELAFAYANASEEKLALEAIARANKLHPLDPSHWLARAELQIQFGHPAEAREALERARALARSPMEEARLRRIDAHFATSAAAP